MGCQGDVYLIFGLTVPATIKSKAGSGRDGWDTPVIYEINGKTVSHDWEAEDIDTEAGIMHVNLNEPELSIRVLGHNHEMGSRHFKGTALLGYTLANECYIDSASQVPEFSVEKLGPLLVQEIKDQFGLTVDAKDFRLYLVFDSLN